MTSQSYQNELNYLRTLGKEFAQRHPEAAGFLGPGSRDPDVERLLQGFAFLTARLHDRLDDQYGQIADGFLSALWPQILRPTPSLTMVEFMPDRRVHRRTLTLDRGTELNTASTIRGQYRFKTCRPVTLYPFSLTDIKIIERPPLSLLRLSFRINPGATLDQEDLESLVLHLHGDDPRFTFGWYLWLTQRASRAYFQVGDDSEKKATKIQPVGFDRHEHMFPDSDLELPGHRLFREFFAYGKGLLFVKATNFKSLADLEVDQEFQLCVEFDKEAPSGELLNLSPEAIKLNCTPAINLFDGESRISLDHTRSEYVVRSDEYRFEQFEVYSVNEVVGHSSGSGANRTTFSPYYRQDFTRRVSTPLYRVRYEDIQARYDDRSLHGRECFISFGNTDVARAETLSLRLKLTNRDGASSLSPGQLNQPSEAIPPFVQFANLDKPTPYRSSGGSTRSLWKLVGALTSTRRTLFDCDNLKAIMRLHFSAEDAESISGQWLEAFQGLSVHPDIWVENGTPQRILRVAVSLDCDRDRIPEFTMYGAVICNFLLQNAPINTRLAITLHFQRDELQRYAFGGGDK